MNNSLYTTYSMWVLGDGQQAEAAAAQIKSQARLVPSTSRGGGDAGARVV